MSADHQPQSYCSPIQIIMHSRPIVSRERLWQGRCWWNPQSQPSCGHNPRSLKFGPSFMKRPVGKQWGSRRWHTLGRNLAPLLAAQQPCAFQLICIHSPIVMLMVPQEEEGMTQQAPKLRDLRWPFAESPDDQDVVDTIMFILDNDKQWQIVPDSARMEDLGNISRVRVRRTLPQACN